MTVETNAPAPNDAATRQRRTIITLLAVLIAVVVAAVVVVLVVTANAERQAEREACQARATTVFESFMCD